MATAGIVVGVVSSVFLLALLISAFRNPILRRLALRNAIRWPASTSLIIAGSMVGTAMITGSLVIGDNVRDWANSDVEQKLGEIDQIIFMPDLEGVVDDRVRDNPDFAYFTTQAVGHISVEQVNAGLNEAGSRASINGILPVIQAPVPAQSLGGDSGEVKRHAPEIMALAVDWDELAAFGDDPPSIERPEPGSVVVSEKLSESLDLVVGDSVRLFAGGEPHDFPVASIVPTLGISGYEGMGFRELRGTVLISLDDGQRVLAGGEPVVNTLLISHSGGVFESHRNSGDVRAALEPLLGEVDTAAGFEIVPVKARAAEDPIWITAMFLVFSSFVILAGVLLVVNIYVSLAEERRRSMGVIRSLGMRRGHLVRLFLYEGLFYSVGAAIVGLLIGLGIARLMVYGIDEIIDEVQFAGFVYERNSLMIAALSGIMISMGTVLFTSLRTSNINIVAATRGLPDPKRMIRSRWSQIWPVLILIAGVALTALALSSDNSFAIIIGPSVLIIGVGFILRAVGGGKRLSYLSSRAALSVTFLAAMLYAGLTGELSSAVRAEHEASPGAFFVIGVILIFGSVGILALNLPSVLKPLRWLSTRLRRVLPVTQMSLAYPGARPLPTSFTILMFTLVIFVVTLMQVMIAQFSDIMEGVQGDEYGGFDAVLFPNPANPLPDLSERIAASGVAEFESVQQVSGLFLLQVELPEFAQGDFDDRGGRFAADRDRPLREQLTGVDEVFLSENSTVLVERDAQYASDREAWQALAQDPSLVIVDRNYRHEGGTSSRPELAPGDALQLQNPITGEIFEKRVAGIMVEQFLWETPIRGILINDAALRSEFLTERTIAPTVYLAGIESSADHAAVVAALEREFVASGLQGESLREIMAREQRFLSFLRIIQGFLAFGLLVGIAGLAVVSARAVHQRKRDIGTLRAIGFRKGMILGYFVGEASLVALLGILLGTVTGGLASVMIHRYVIPDGMDTSFVLPVGEIALTSLAILLIAIVFTIIPAVRASRLVPVEALRPSE